jgi:CBS domain containing-hemolysin-like protein
VSLTGGDIALLAVVVVLIGVAAFLAMAETGLTRTNRVKAEALAEEGRHGAATLNRLVRHPERALTPVLFLLLVCHLVAATLIGVVAGDLFGPLGVAAATAFEVVVIFVLAEAVPKTWAVQNPERAALAAAPGVSVLARFPPLRWLTQGLIAIANFIIPGRGIKEGPYVSEEELLAMADAAAEGAAIETEERALIHSIIDFGDTVVREVMKPRTDMVAVEATARIRDVIDVAITAGYSRIPIFGQGIDDIVGMAFLKDLIHADRNGHGDDPVSTIVRGAHFVPETKKVSELMREMQQRKFHQAIVVDEYGGTAGLVTLEDLLEELVGEIIDEYDVEEEPVERLDGGDVRVSARMPIDEVNELVDAELPEGDWDTVGGLVYSLLGHVPEEGEAVDFDGHRLTAEKVEGQRIGLVRISKAAGPAREHPAEPAEAPPVDHGS